MQMVTDKMRVPLTLVTDQSGLMIWIGGDIRKKCNLVLEGFSIVNAGAQPLAQPVLINGTSSQVRSVG